MIVYGIYNEDDTPLLSIEGRHIHFQSKLTADGYCYIYPEEIKNKKVQIEYDPTKHKVAGIR